MIKQQLLKLILVLIFTGGISTYSHGQCTDGNSNTTNTNFATGNLANSFVADCSGNLTSVELQWGGADPSFSIELFEGNGTGGTQVGTSVTGLASAGSGLNNFESFDVSSGGFSVTSGNTYTIQVSAANNLIYDQSGGSAFSEGILYFNGGAQSTLDMVFRVNVTAAASTPEVTLSSSATSALETGGSITVTATASSAPASALTVPLQFTGTATTGVDYTGSGDITISGGSTTGSITLNMTSDVIYEPGGESLNVAINSTTISGATVGSPSSVALTITDDDSQPTITINDVTQNEGIAGTTNFTFTISLSNPSSETIGVNYASADGSALAGVDYTSVSGSLSFTPGQTSKIVTVLVNGETLDENDETFTVNLSSPTNATISDASGTGTISNDDTAFQPNATLEVLSIYNPITNENGGQAYVRGVLDAVSGKTITIPLSFSGTATGGGTDYSITSSTISLGPGDTMDSIRITSQFDGIPEGDETIIIDMNPPTNAVEDGVQQVTITIQDADCTAPSAASSLVFGTLTASTIDLNSFTSGSGDGFAVYVNSTNSFTAPTDGSEPVADLSWNDAGQQPIYFGTSSSPNITVTSLSEGATYYFAVYSYTACGTFEKYETTGAVASSSTLDLTAPSFENSTPSSSSVGGTSFTLNTDINEAGDIFYVVLSNGATAPTSTEVVNGTGNSGAAAVTSDNATVSTGGFTNAFSVTGLTSETAYDVYVVARDDEGTPNLQASPTLVNVTTADITAPSFENSTPSSSSVGGTSFTLNTDINEAGDIFYVVLSDGATAPTSTEVVNGTGNSGAAAVTSDNATVSTGGFTNAFSVSGLTSETAYDVYVVARDDEGTPNLQASPTLVNVTTADITAPSFENSTPNASSIGATNFTLNTDINEAGDIFYVVLSDGATAPTSTEVVNGTGNSGATAVTSDNATVSTGGFTNAFSVTGLSSEMAYDVYVVARDDEGTPNLQASPTLVNVTTADITAPSFENSTPSSSSVGGTSFTLNTDINEAGDIFYVVLSDGATAPTSTEVVNGTGNSGAAAVTSDNVTVSTGGFTNAFSVTGLSSETAYDVYVVARDDEGTPNLQASPTLVNVTTADITAPSFENSTPNASSIGGTSFTLNTDINEAGDIFYVVLSDGATAPTSTEVVNGTGNSGATAVTSDNVTVSTGGFTNAFSVTGLSSETAYDVYVVARDDEGSPNLQASPTLVNVTTADITAPRVTRIERQTPGSSPTNADAVTFRFTFNEDVTAVGSADFEVTGPIGVSVGVTGANDVYDVTVSGGDMADFEGTVTISFASGQDITDVAGNALTDTSPTTVNVTTYILDNTAPEVTSIVRQNPTGTPTNADVLVFRLTFNSNVTAVNDADFEVTGPTGESIGVVGSGTTYDVTVSGGDMASLNNDVTLSFASGQNITDVAGNPLVVTTPTGTNDNTYTVDNTAPTVSTLSPADNAIDVSLSSDFVITFSDDVVVNSGNLTVHRVSDDGVVRTFDVTNNTIVSVSGNVVTFDNTTDLALNTEHYILLDNGAFEDEAGNAYGGIFSTTAWSFTTTDETEITINDPSVTEGNTGSSNLTFTVSLSQPAPSGGATVDYATSDGTATAGTDYTATSGTLSFAAGESSKTIDVVVSGDLMLEPNETVVLTLSNPTGTNVIISDNTGTGTINDNDNAAVTIGDFVTNEDDGAFTFSAQLDNPVQGGFTVDVSTADGTATVADNDYTAVTGQTLTFVGTAGETQNITVVPTADTKLEPDENLTVSMSNLAATTLSVDITDEGTINIINDDEAMVTIADVSSNEDDGAITLTATLNAEVVGGFSVDVSTADGTATIADGDYTAISGETLTFAGNQGETQTFTLTPTADTKVEIDESVNISLSNLAGTALSIDITDGAVVTILNDDITEIQFVGTEGNGSEAISSHQFGIELTRSAAIPVTVDYSVTGTATGSGTDHTLTNGTLTIAAGNTSGTLDITGIVDDEIVELNETVIVTLANPTNAILGANTVYTYTITDNDNATLSIEATNQAAEDATNGLFTITTSNQFSTDVVVNIVVAGTAEEGTDYETIGTNFTFPAATNTATIPVTVLADPNVETEETVILTLTGTNNSNVMIGTPAEATITISDNDDMIPQTISFSPISDKRLSEEVVVLEATGGDSGEPVTFTISTEPAAGVASLANGTIQLEGTGTVTVTASQAGNDFYLPADDVTQTFLIISDELFLPTLFTPNNDQQNDAFIIRGGASIDTIVFSIYDRDGNLVFRSTDINELTQQGWDGTSGGTSLPQGAYIWVVSGSFSDGTPLIINGKTTDIIRLAR